jgi:hypothetical protein
LNTVHFGANNTEFQGALDLSVYVLKTDTAAAGDVWHTASRWVGGPSGTKTASTIPNCTAVIIKAGVTIDDVTGDYPGGLTADQLNAIADAVLSRDVSQVEANAAEHSLCYTVLVMSESNTTAHAGKLTVYRTDGTTEFVRKTIASAGGAAAITGVS